MWSLKSILDWQVIFSGDVVFSSTSYVSNMQLHFPSTSGAKPLLFPGKLSLTEYKKHVIKPSRQNQTEVVWSSEPSQVAIRIHEFHESNSPSFNKWGSWETFQSVLAPQGNASPKCRSAYADVSSLWCMTNDSESPPEQSLTFNISWIFFTFQSVRNLAAGLGQQPLSWLDRLRPNESKFNG